MDFDWEDEDLRLRFNGSMVCVCSSSCFKSLYPLEPCKLTPRNIRRGLAEYKPNLAPEDAQNALQTALYDLLEKRRTYRVLASLEVET